MGEMYSVYFIAILLLGLWLIVAAVVAIFQKEYQDYRTQQKQANRFYVITGYIAAFTLLDEQRDRSISLQEFRNFMKYLNFSDSITIHAREIATYFHRLNRDDSDGVNIVEFIDGIDELFGEVLRRRRSEYYEFGRDFRLWMRDSWFRTWKYRRMRLFWVGINMWCLAQ